METLLEGRCGVPYFTDLRLVFRAIGDRQREFDWLVTDLDYGRLGVHDHRPPPFIGRGPHWLTGAQLTRQVAEYDLQFAWAVLSGFPPGTPLDLDRLAVDPYADGNPGFWEEQPRIQHPLAEVEIVCWDSTATLLLCRDRSLGESFRRHFPEAVDLAEYNEARRTTQPICPPLVGRDKPE
ncbi:MAG: hypothetical protein ACRC33_05415 [Gemmataceae bacterium]